MESDDAGPISYKMIIYFCYIASFFCLIFFSNISPPKKIPSHPHSGPVNNLQEGDSTEPEEEAKEATKGGDKLNWSHRYVSLHV